MALILLMRKCFQLSNSAEPFNDFFPLKAPKPYLVSENRLYCCAMSCFPSTRAHISLSLRVCSFLFRARTPISRAVVLESGLGLESGLETFFYRLGLVLDSLVFVLGLVSDLVIGLAKCSSWSRPSPAIYAFFSLSKQRLACSANG